MFKLKVSLQFFAFCELDEMENVFSAARPFLIFAKFIGLFPFSLKAQDETRSHWIDYIFVFCYVSAASFIFYISFFVDNLFTNLMESKTSVTGWNVNIYLSNIIIFIQFCYQYWKKNNIFRFLNTINDFDEMVREISWYFIKVY